MTIKTVSVGQIYDACKEAVGKWPECSTEIYFDKNGFLLVRFAGFHLTQAQLRHFEAHNLDLHETRGNGDRAEYQFLAKFEGIAE